MQKLIAIVTLLSFLLTSSGFSQTKLAPVDPASIPTGVGGVGAMGTNQASPSAAAALPGLNPANNGLTLPSVHKPALEAVTPAKADPALPLIRSQITGVETEKPRAAASPKEKGAEEARRSEAPTVRDALNSLASVPEKADTGQSAAHFQAAYDVGHGIKGLSASVEVSAASGGGLLSRLSRLLKPQGALRMGVAHTERDEALKDMIKLRYGVEADAKAILKQVLGGEVKDEALRADLRRIYDRLAKAAGISPESIQVYVGGSRIPNAFTLTTKKEIEYAGEKKSMSHLKVANVFLSVGILRAARTETELAMILAHELQHNLLGHLKNDPGSHLTLGHFFELEADGEALKLIAAAGYDPREAGGFLECLEDQYRLMEKEYPELARDSSDLAKSEMSFIAVHPHHDVRRANLTDYMSEALESYERVAAEGGTYRASGTPAWKARSEPSVMVSPIDLLGKEVDATVAQGSLEQRLHALERVLQRETEENRMGQEQGAVFAKGYRVLVAMTKNLQDLSYVQVSLERQSAKHYILTKRLQGDITDRMLDFVFQELGGHPRMSAVLKAVLELPEEVRRIAAYRVLGTIRTRAEFTDALDTLSRKSELFGLEHPGSYSDRQKAVSSRLWKAMRRILESELGRPPLPEEIIDQLRVSAPSWLKDYRDGFQVEIAASVFGQEKYRSKKYRPSELAYRLRENVPDHYTRGEFWHGEYDTEEGTFQRKQGLKGFMDWANDHYTSVALQRKRNSSWSGSFSRDEQEPGGYKPEQTDEPQVTYEKYRLNDVRRPSMEDLNDLLRWFETKPMSAAGSEGRVVVRQLRRQRSLLRDWGGTPSSEDMEYWPKPLVRLLRREGMFDAFVRDRVLDLSGALRGKLAQGPSRVERFEHVRTFGRQVAEFMDASLTDASELVALQKTASAIWSHIEEGLAGTDGTESLSQEERDILADGFNKALAETLRSVVLELDRRGERPDPKALAPLGELAARIDTYLGRSSRREAVRAHANRLLELSSGEQAKYMEGFGLALRDSVKDVRTPAERNQVLPALTWYDFAQFLAMNGDASLKAEERLMIAAMLDKLANAIPEPPMKEDDNEVKSREVPEGEVQQACQILGGWFMSDAVSGVTDKGQAVGLNALAARLHGLHPGFLTSGSLASGSLKNGFREFGAYLRRGETWRTILRGEHPFRGISVRWALAWLARLDELDAWPESTEDTLDLLDFLNATGEFSDVLDRRILSIAKADPEGFLRWAKRDEKRTEAESIADAPPTFETPYGRIPYPRATALRIVRNPNLRAELVRVVPEYRLGETPKRTLMDKLRTKTKLAKAYRNARRFFSREFLESLGEMKSMAEKLLQLSEEVDRVAVERTEAARERWEAGKFTRADKAWYMKVRSRHDRPRNVLDSAGDFLKALARREKGETRWWQFWKWEWRPWKWDWDLRKKLRRIAVSELEDFWAKADALERKKLLKEYEEALRQDMWDRLMALYQAFMADQDPMLTRILSDFPEPIRVRDDLLERLIKARRLAPEQLAFMEGHKSYRMPNPLRRAEKIMMDHAILLMKKFSPAEKVDMLLHFADIRPLSEATQKAMSARILRGQKKRLVREQFAVSNIFELKNYVSLMHPKDRAMIVRSMFYGEGSLSTDPAQVMRLFHRLVIHGRDLEPLLKRVLWIYFRDILDQDEKAKLVSDMAAVEDLQEGLTGPQILRVALGNMGVTGKKVGQVMSTHRGLMGEKYGSAMEGFEDKAQSMNKMRGYTIAAKRLDELSGGEVEDAYPVSQEELLKLSMDALPGVDVKERERLARQVQALLEQHKVRVKRIEEVGPELGAGSIKLVYKLWLDDGRIWVVKVRAPGAAYRIRREFEILEQLEKRVREAGLLDLPAVKQLLDEVRILIEAEMDFRKEAEIEKAEIASQESRPWYARLWLGRRTLIPRPHEVYVSDDVMVEGFMATKRFRDLPKRSLIGPSQSKIARRMIREGVFSLVYEGWLDPDPHPGNRPALWRSPMEAVRSAVADVAAKRWSRLPGRVPEFFGALLDRVRTVTVLIDRGQGRAYPLEKLTPFMKPAMALEAGKTADAAALLADMVQAPPDRTHAQIEEAVLKGLKESPETGTVERMMVGLLGAENERAVISPEYAPVQKAFLLYMGYSPLLPKDYLLSCLQQAYALKLLSEGKVSLWTLLRLGLKRAVYGPEAVQPELERLMG
ncbi:MAG: AarF/UbiB family protein [Elusimicrobiota bacterium]